MATTIKSRALKPSAFQKLEVLLYRIALNPKTPKSIAVRAADLLLSKFTPGCGVAKSGDALQRVETALLKVVE